MVFNWFSRKPHGFPENQTVLWKTKLVLQKTKRISGKPNGSLEKNGCPETSLVCHKIGSTSRSILMQEAINKNCNVWQQQSNDCDQLMKMQLIFDESWFMSLGTVRVKCRGNQIWFSTYYCMSKEIYWQIFVCVEL